MRLLSMIMLVVAAALLAPGNAVPNELSEADLKEAIVLRCHYQMGEFGVEAVQVCIERDNAAFAAFSHYSERDKSIVSRCAQSGPADGWELARACADRDIEAEAALAHYPAGDAGLIEDCRKEMRERGPAQVKACADQRISARAGRQKQ